MQGDMNKTAKDDVVTTVRLPREEHALLKALAAKEERTLGAQIRFMLVQQRETA